METKEKAVVEEELRLLMQVTLRLERELYEVVRSK